MFFRPGGTVRAPNRQYDVVYVDFADGATDWLPVARGNLVAVNVCRASIEYTNAVVSRVIKTDVAPECVVLLENKQFGYMRDNEAWPIDRWQNLVVATSRRPSLDGWWRLRLLNVNNMDGTGIALTMQVNRTGDSGVDV